MIVRLRWAVPCRHTLGDLGLLPRDSPPQAGRDFRHRVSPSPQILAGMPARHHAGVAAPPSGERVASTPFDPRIGPLAVGASNRKRLSPLHRICDLRRERLASDDLEIMSFRRGSQGLRLFVVWLRVPSDDLQGSRRFPDRDRTGAAGAQGSDDRKKTSRCASGAGFGAARSAGMLSGLLKCFHCGCHQKAPRLLYEVCSVNRETASVGNDRLQSLT